DVYSLEMFKRDENGRPATLKARWEEEFQHFADHYDLTETQKADGQEALEDAEAKLDAWFNDLGHSQEVEKYELDVRHVLEIQESPETLRYQKAKTYDERKKLESTRRELVASIREISDPMHEVWVKELTDEQREKHGPVKAEMTPLDWINLTTAWGLTFAGIGLMLGFLTPLAALVGAGLLAMFYLSMPPWPGLPEPPNVEGHYWIVNKNLIELLACLVLASTPNGLWIGLDALFFGGIGQRKRLAQATEPPPGSNPVVVIAEPDRPRGPAESHSSPSPATGATKR
ncbi:MAG TPA: DoxX family protein, partial [Isosphaeraceae bacterium]|nr:DoxX family protein [Isosphaeraceae bacterium]